MEIRELHVARVINNIDPKVLGRVQILVNNMMEGWIPQPVVCPWALPFSMGTGGLLGLSSQLSVPEFGSLVWVFFEKPDLKRNPFYIADVHLSGFQASVLNPALLASATALGAKSVYPDVKFQVLKNGVVMAMTSGVTPEAWISLPNGAAIFLDSLGTAHLKSLTSEVSVGPTGITISGLFGAVPPQPMVMGQNLITALTAFATTQAAASTGPLAPLLAGFNALLAALPLSLSLSNKNN